MELKWTTLKRIDAEVNAFTGRWQCAYKQGRSCADIAWCQHVMLSVVQQKRWEYYHMGIGMSSAFDTTVRTRKPGVSLALDCSKWTNHDAVTRHFCAVIGPFRAIER